MPPSTRSRSRLTAAGLATALAASVVVTAAPAAQAAEAAPASLSWSISQQFVDHLSTRVLSDGAAFDSATSTFSFPGEATSVAANGDVTHSYDGSVRGAFAMGPTEYYAVTIADPEVTVESDGDGAVTALVSAKNAAAGGNPAAETDPKRVTVAEFGDAAITATGVSATPDWAGVLPADSAPATALGVKAGQPVDGKSFHPDFLAQLTAGVRAHFYASGSTSDPKKSPGVVTGQAVPSVTATVTEASYDDGVTLAIRGAGFNPVTNPGDDGVYVGLAPADAVIDYSDRENGMTAFAIVDWVRASDFSGGAFSRSLTARTEKLKPGTAYVLHTWQAHTHSNTSQDTITPVQIDWSKLQAPVVRVKPTMSVKLGKAATTRAAGKATIAVSGRQGAATGKVRVQVLRQKKVVKRLGVVTLNRAGKVTVTLPRGARGWRILKVSYLGDTGYTAITKSVRFRIKK